MKRKALVMLMLSAIAMVPASSSASHNHCQGYIFSGVATGVENPTFPGTDIRQGLNLRANGNGCTNHALSVDTAYITPGATHAWAGAPSGAAYGTPSGTIQFNNGTQTTISWAKNTTPGRERWESKASYPIPAGTTKITLRLTQSGNSTTTVAYRSAP